VVAVVAKLGTAAMVGQFALALAITAPVFMLTALNLRGIQATDTKGEFAFGDYARLRVVTVCIALGAVAVALALTSYGRDVMLITAAVALAKAVESISDVCYGGLQRNERMDRIAKSMIARGMLSLAAIAAALAMTGSLLVGAIAMAAAWAAVLVLYDLPNVAPFAATAVANERFAAIRRLVPMALPLGVVMMLISLNANVPRFFIENELGEASLGYYSAIAYLSFAATTVMNALGQAAVSQLAQRFGAPRREAFVSLLFKLVAVAALLGIGGWAVAAWIGRPLLALVYTPEYREYAPLLTLTMAVTTVSLMASALGYGMTAMRRFRVQLPIFVLVVAANVVGCVVLVPRIGLYGAVWALAASAFVQLSASAYVVARGLRHENR
jgi:O-antigen/teichoic acid export membrane protein